MENKKLLMENLKLVAKVRYEEQELDWSRALIWDQDKSSQVIWDRLRRRLSEQGYDTSALPDQAPRALKKKEKDMHGLRFYNEVADDDRVYHLFVGIYLKSV